MVNEEENGKLGGRASIPLQEPKGYDMTMNWIIKNKEWLFSGIGVALVSWIVTLFFPKKLAKKTIRQTQKSGKNSTNVQVGENLSFGSDKFDER